MTEIIYLEDLKPGESHEYGTVEVTADTIKDFARRYDPQPFHLKEEAAENSIFKGLAASGWHTAAMTMQLLTRYSGHNMAGLGSPGFDDLRWRRPVRPGDRLRVRTTCLDIKPSHTHPERGTARFAIETVNQDDDVVMQFTSLVLVARKPE
jgi:acyl dehydratase